MANEDETASPSVEARILTIKEASAAFARAVSHASYAQGNVSWPREIAIAHQKIEEALMWALKGLGAGR